MINFEKENSLQEILSLRRMAVDRVQKQLNNLKKVDQILEENAQEYITALSSQKFSWQLMQKIDDIDKSFESLSDGDSDDEGKDDIFTSKYTIKPSSNDITSLNLTINKFDFYLRQNKIDYIVCFIKNEVDN